MPLTASKLRQDIYRILDRVLETGVPVQIHRKGRVLRITVDKPPSKMASLRSRPYLLENPDRIVHLDFSDEWMP